MLTEQEKDRYHRHLIIPDFGEVGQQQIKLAKVLVIGAGGLGSSILFYLAASGIGKIGIVDYDTVTLSNLQRQILFTEADIGKHKAQLAVDRLSKLNNSIEFEAFNEKLDDNLADFLFPKFDIIVGATDNFSSRVLIDSYCARYKKTFIHGSVYEFEGHVSVFDYHYGKTYQQLFNELPDDSSTAIGVFAPLVGLIGCLMAGEVMKIILNRGTILKSYLFIYNILTHQMNLVKIS